ncbi:MAG: gamma-glutamylcyclotransferase [Gammaproteobacteria bacterium]|nr:gamma-glutamylcyclotransferase [Gammaproteobacteria bacterium]
MAVEYYFAYGSNMNPERVSARGLAFVEIRPGRLDGVRLVFDKVSRNHPHAAHANIVYAPGAFVEGVLYRLRSAGEILKMDPFERAPVNYGRDAVEVFSEDERIPAWTYFANLAVRRNGFKPPRSYLDHLLAGRPYLSPGYYRRLQGIDCAD